MKTVKTSVQLELHCFIHEGYIFMHIVLTIDLYCTLQLALYVLSFLEPRDLLQAAQTCNYWRILADDNLLWREKCREESIDQYLGLSNQCHMFYYVNIVVNGLVHKPERCLFTFCSYSNIIIIGWNVEVTRDALFQWNFL